MMSEQEQAIMAYQKLFNNFSTDQSGNIIYPENYGGEFVEDNKLILLLTDISEDTTSPYNEMLEEYNCVEFRQVDYSLNYLSNLADSTVAKLRQFKVNNY